MLKVGYVDFSSGVFSAIPIFSSDDQRFYLFSTVHQPVWSEPSFFLPLVWTIVQEISID